MNLQEIRSGEKNRIISINSSWIGEVLLELGLDPRSPEISFSLVLIKKTNKKRTSLGHKYMMILFCKFAVAV